MSSSPTFISKVLLQSISKEVKETSYGRSYTIKLTLCQHTFEWIIDYFIQGKVFDHLMAGSFDVIPNLPSFREIDYDPYKPINDVMRFLEITAQRKSSMDKVNVLNIVESNDDDVNNKSSDSGDRILNRIIEILFESIVFDQREKVKGLHKSMRSSLFLDMVATFNDQSEIYYLVRRLNKNQNVSNLNNFQSLHVVVEFPLLDKARLSQPELEYLTDFTGGRSHSIIVRLTSTDVSETSSFNTKPTLHFPKNILPNLRHLESHHVPISWNPNSTTLYDYLPEVEQKILITWGVRKKFIAELQNISSVIELDPVDFSYVSLSLRLTKAKRFMLSIIDLRIPPSFPNAPILLVTHDLLSGTSYPLENKNTLLSNPSLFGTDWNPERMAREYFVALCNEMVTIAFGSSK